MVRRSTLAAMLAMTLLLAGSASGDPGTDKARLDARIGALRAQADRAARTEGVLTTELSRLTARARAAREAANVEEQRLSVLEASLAAERVRLATLERQIADQSARLVVLEREYATALATLERRLRVIYESDAPSLIAFALGTTSFSDLVDSLELLDRIGRQDERVATALDRARTSLQRTRAASEQARVGAARSEALIAARAEAQRATRDRIVASRNELAAAEGAKSGALATVREDRASFIAEADGLAAESAALAARIVAAQSQASAGVPPAAASPEAPASSGQLSWPLTGPLTSRFGERWGRMHEGIDIAVGSGTPVRAAAAGTVVYSGYMSGYGYVVVLDHGNGLSTAYAHNSSLSVTQGATVGAGSVIALSGNSGRSTGPHLHFEVRVGGAAVDPLGYL